MRCEGQFAGRIVDAETRAPIPQAAASFTSELEEGQVVPVETFARLTELRPIAVPTNARANPFGEDEYSATCTPAPR